MYCFLQQVAVKLTDNGNKITSSFGQSLFYGPIHHVLSLIINMLIHLKS